MCSDLYAKATMEERASTCALVYVHSFHEEEAMLRYAFFATTFTVYGFSLHSHEIYTVSIRVERTTQVLNQRASPSSLLTILLARYMVHI